MSTQASWRMLQWQSWRAEQVFLQLLLKKLRAVNGRPYTYWKKEQLVSAIRIILFTSPSMGCWWKIVPDLADIAAFHMVSLLHPDKDIQSPRQQDAWNWHPGTLEPRNKHHTFLAYTFFIAVYFSKVHLVPNIKWSRRGICGQWNDQTTSNKPNLRFEWGKNVNIFGGLMGFNRKFMGYSWDIGPNCWLFVFNFNSGEPWITVFRGMAEGHSPVQAGDYGEEWGGCTWPGNVSCQKNALITVCGYY